MSDLKDILSSASQWLAILDNLVDEKKGDFISVINHQQKVIDNSQKRIDNLLEAVEKGELFRNRIKLLKNQSVLPSDYLENDIFIFDKALEKDKEL